MEEILPKLNKEICGADSAPCDAMCGGPGSKCSQCGGNSCGGSVSNALQAEEFAKEADVKAQAKFKEGEEVLF